MKNKLKSISLFTVSSYLLSMLVVIVHLTIMDHVWNPMTNSFEHVHDHHHDHHHDQDHDHDSRENQDHHCSEGYSLCIFSEFNNHDHYAHNKYEAKKPGHSFFFKIMASAPPYSVLKYVFAVDPPIISVDCEDIDRSVNILTIAPKQSPPVFFA